MPWLLAFEVSVANVQPSVISVADMDLRTLLLDIADECCRQYTQQLPRCLLDHRSHNHKQNYRPGRLQLARLTSHELKGTA